MTLLDFAHFAVSDTVQTVSLVIICVGVITNLLFLTHLILASIALVSDPPVRQTGLLAARYGDVVPPVAILVPAYNEEMNIVDSVHALLGIRYPMFEVIVVNDGSKDGTMQRLKEAFNLTPTYRAQEPSLKHAPLLGVYASPDHPTLLVLDKENGGKADALNAAIRHARSPIICSIDADSILEPDALLRAVRPFVEDPENMVAVGGTVRVANGCRIEHGEVKEVALPSDLLGLFQTVEYMRAFLVGRLGWSRIGALTVISGAFGLFRRQEVLDVGGYDTTTVGEDMELVVKLQHRLRKSKPALRMAFVPEPVCWTEVPKSLSVLARQRTRWQRGSIETLVRHWGMTFNPRYGALGIVGFGYVFLVEALGPLMEAIGYVFIPAMVALNMLSIEYLLAFLAASATFGVFLSLGALALAELELKRFPRVRDLLVLSGAAIVENFGYRQLNNFWRLQGLIQFLTGHKSWGVMTRSGFRKA